MDSERFEEIILLAESIANENFIDGKTDLLSIVAKKEIVLIEGHYEDYFLGNLLHASNKFYLYLNRTKLSNDQNPRIRFTIAHELGHYFLDEHRNLLKSGISLSFNKQQTGYLLEKEANHFASFLLMPREKFLKRASEFENGLLAILSLANEFEVSIACTSIHYMELDCCSGLLIRWNEDNSLGFSNCSSSLSSKINIKAKPSIKLNTLYLDDIKSELVNRKDPYDILEKATTLSKWIASIAPNSTKDLIALEQTIKLGNFGGLTLITYNAY